MSKYIKLEDAIKKVEEHILPDFRGKAMTILSDLPTIEVSEDCISVEDIGKTLNEWLADKEMARFATKILRLNAPRVIPTTEQYSLVHCKDCKYFMDNVAEDNADDECRWRTDEMPNADDYCSYGEKK